MPETGLDEKTVLEAARCLTDPRQQAAFLDAACGGDAGLRQRVEEMLGLQTETALAPSQAPTDQSYASTLRSFATGQAQEKAGDRIGPYKLLEQIGEGGMGSVWMAEQQQPFRRVALKVVKLGMDTKQVIARFRAEQQALALMDHPNIAKAFEIGAAESGRPFFVMELVRGIPITAYCDKEKRSTPERLNLLVQVCHAIQHAHQKGVIHRDIKPSNILVTMLDGEPVPKVIDFGIAKATQGKLVDETLFTAFEQFIGTPAYMSPEQAEMNALDIDTRSDVYSLGVLLYELLSGSTPFDTRKLLGAGLNEIRRVIREVDPPRPSTRLSSLEAADQTSVARQRRCESPKLLATIRGDLDWIVMKCLEKDRRRRYQTASDLATDVQRYLKDEAVLARPPSNIYRLGKMIRRNRLAVAAAGALVLVVAAGSVVSAWQAVRATRAERVQSRLRAQAENEAAKSRQVALFLEEMLRGAAPFVAMGRDTTLIREIVAKTAERVGKDLTNQPAVEAELRNTLAKVYTVVGQFDEAEAMQRQALALRQKLFGPEHLLVAESLASLAIALNRQGKFRDAEQPIREALRIQTKLLGAENEEVADSMVTLSASLWGQGKVPESDDLSRRVLGLRRKINGTEHPAVALALVNLGVRLEYEDKFADAEALFRESLVMRQRLFGERHPDVAQSLTCLATLLRLEYKLEEAEATARKALALNREILPPNHPDLALSLGELAIIFRLQHKLAEAEKVHREALGIRRAALGPNNPEVADSLNNLGNVLRDQGKLTEAEAMYRESLDLRRKIKGERHRDVAQSLNNLGTVLWLEGNLAEAETFLRQALALRRSLHNDFHSSVGDSLSYLGQVLHAGNKLAEAEIVFREELAIRKKANVTNQVTSALCDLAGCLLEEQKWDETEALARESLALVEKPGPDDTDKFSASSILGAALSGQQKHTQAEALLVSGYEGLKQREALIPATDRIQLTRALQRLIQFYETTGNTLKAEEWRKKVPSRPAASA